MGDLVLSQCQQHRFRNPFLGRNDTTKRLFAAAKKALHFVVAITVACDGDIPNEMLFVSIWNQSKLLPDFFYR